MDLFYAKLHQTVWLIIGTSLSNSGLGITSLPGPKLLELPTLFLGQLLLSLRGKISGRYQGQDLDIELHHFSLWWH